MFMLPMVGYGYCLESRISWLNLFRIKQTTQEGRIINSRQTECMDLETKPLEEQKKDEHSNKNTLKEYKNEVANISSEVDRAVNTFMKGCVISSSHCAL